MSDIVERVRDLSNLLWQQGYEAGLAAAKAKIDRLREANESVAVCSDHTSEIVRFDGCVICENERLRKVVDEILHAANPPTNMSGQEVCDWLREIVRSELEES